MLLARWLNVFTGRRLRKSKRSRLASRNSTVEQLEVRTLLAAVSAPESEPNDTFGTATTLTVVDKTAIATGKISVGDADYYSFTAAAGSRVWITADSGGVQNVGATSRDTVIDLLNTNGTTVIESDDNDGTGNGGDGMVETLDASAIAGATLVTGGTYYVRVRESTGTGVVDPYTLFVTITDTAAVPETEPNDTSATANPIANATVRSGELAPKVNNFKDTYDYYSFNANAGDRVHISADADPERDFGTSLVVELHDPANNLLLKMDSSTVTTAAAEAANFNITATGTYFVLVRHSSAVGIGTYHLMVAVRDGAAPTALITVSDPTITDADTLGTGTFTVTVDYSEAMDTGTDPTIGLLPSASGTLTFNAGLSGWTDSNTYVAKYDVADVDVETANVDVTVSGAKDVAGNTQVSSTSTAAFDIDTLNPTVTAITVSDTLITDADIPGTFTVTVDYSEVMDTGTPPTIGFLPSVSGTLTFNAGLSGWTDSNTYVAKYDVADANVKTPAVDVTASGAKDVSGNTQVSSTSTAAFSIDTTNPIIDTLNPTVVSVTANPFLVTTTGGILTLTVDFSEPMKTTSPFPTLTFLPSMVGKLSNLSAVWTDSDTYTVTYKVTDVSMVALVAVDVSDAKDAAGNLQQDYLPQNEFVIGHPNSATLVPDFGGGGNVLLVIGTSRDDHLEFHSRRVGTVSFIRVQRGSSVLGDFPAADVGRLLAYGLGGNDVIYVDHRLNLPTELHGGAGNDVLLGGSGDDQLFGDDGNDKLGGNGGDDNLFGGNGMDTLNGSCGDDLLMGGADDDMLNDNAGHNMLIGGTGRDKLTHGADC